MNQYKLLSFLLFYCCMSCMHNSETAKIQNNRNNIINIHEKIKELVIEDVLISNHSRIHVFDKYLMIIDYGGIDKLIHIFDKNDFTYITSTGEAGPGPDELSNIGMISYNASNRILYVPDNGKNTIFCFELDSIITQPHYIPKERLKFSINQIPNDLQYMNDSIAIGSIIIPTSNSDYRPAVGIWNMRTNDIKLINSHDHPQIERKRTSFAVSVERGIFVEAYRFHNLMTICDLDGNLKCYIYGNKWDTSTQNRFVFYQKVGFCKDKIIASYTDGDVNFIHDQNSGMRQNNPTQLIFFNINGDYLKTIETGYKIIDFCYDNDNNRICMVLDDEIQFAYLDLDGIL